MKKFQFRFSTLLQVRKSREDVALRAMSAAQRAFHETILRKQKLLGDLETALVRREALGKEPTRITVFQLEQDFIVGTKQRIIQADHAIQKASRAFEKAMRAYLAARQQTKMMETLKDKELEQHREEVRKREQKEMDDLSIMRARFKEKAS